MKCPKCGYLGFESGDRCRNCGYNFSLARPAPATLDFALDGAVDEPRPFLDLDRIIGAPDPENEGSDLPLFPPPQMELAQPAASAPRLERAKAADVPDAPLITGPLRPRAPLGVRRATPEVPRARARAQKPAASAEDTLFELPPAAMIGHDFESKTAYDGLGGALATPLRRIFAAMVDLALLSALDAVVLYFTLRLTSAEMFHLPVLPLAAFFLLLNGGYFVAFTAVGGQSIGKMAAGIRVITQEDGSVPVGQATVRTLAYLVSALPLGAGFLPGVLGADRLALHDRLAHTRVVRPTST